jgi:hypothetical protein
MDKYENETETNFELLSIENKNLILKNSILTNELNKFLDEKNVLKNYFQSIQNKYKEKISILKNYISKLENQINNE